jgi:hypothetical protein
VNKEASHYVRLFGGNKIGNLIFLLPLVHYLAVGHSAPSGLEQRQGDLICAVPNLNLVLRSS